MMKILILGGSGQVGTELQRILREMTSEIGVVPDAYKDASVDAPSHKQLNICSKVALTRWMKAHGPYDLIINCAALTDVDYCQAHEAEALRINAIAVDHLAKSAQAQNAIFIQLSTDQVYGYECSFYNTEDNQTTPINAYGRSKLAGEAFAKEACERLFIVRTSWVFGYKGNNFVKTILKLAKEQGKISVVNDQVSSPTSANDLADGILRLALTKKYGIYNITNSSYCSKFEFAKKITTTKRIKCEKEEISTAEFLKRNPTSAPRPSFTVLAPWKTESLLGIRERSWEAALAQYLKNLPTLGED